MENGLQEAQKLPNRYNHISRSQGNLSEFFFVHYWGCGRHFSGGDRSDLLKSRPPSVPIGFVPQKLGLIWWVPWECKNLGELNFHMENGLPEAQKLPNRYYHISRSQGNLSEFFSFTIGVVGGTFLEVIAQIYSKGDNCSICGSVSVFVR